MIEKNKSVIFDTHSYFNELITAGVPHAQADAHTKSLKDIFQKNLATKSDVHDVRSDLSRDMKELELRMKIFDGSLAILIITTLTLIQKLL